MSLRWLFAAVGTLLCSAEVGDLYRHDGRVLDLSWGDAGLVISKGLVGPPAIYAVGSNRVLGRGIHIYRLSAENKLERIGFQAMRLDEGTEPRYSVTISPDDRHLYVTNQRLAMLRTYARQADGTLRSEDEMTVWPTPDSNHFTFDPTGRHLYWVHSRESSIYCLTRDAATGRLTNFRAAFNETATLFRAINVTDDGRYMLAVSTQGRLMSLRRDSQSGDLIEAHTAWFDTTGNGLGLFGTAVFTSANNGVIYSFLLNPSTGRLTEVQRMETNVPRPLGRIAATRNGVYVAQGEQGIVVVHRDPSTGLLNLLESMNEWPGAVLDLQLTQGTDHLVVTRGGGLHVYKRATACGIGVPEPCASSSSSSSLPSPYKRGDPTARCKLVREDLERDGSVGNTTECVVDVYEEEQRGFFCRDTRNGIVLGLDRVPTLSAHANPVLSFITRDTRRRIGFSLSHKTKTTEKDGLFRAPLAIADVVRIDWPRADDSSFVSFFPMQGGATICFNSHTLCCVLPPEYGADGGECTFTVTMGYAYNVRVTAAVIPSAACPSGYLLRRTLPMRREPQTPDVVFEGCAVPDLTTPQGLVQSMSSMQWRGGFPEEATSDTIRARVDCTPSSSSF